MSESPAKEISLFSSSEKRANNKLSESSIEEISKTITDELVIGVCGPIGSPLDEVCKNLEDILNKRGYTSVIIIKASQIIEEIGKTTPATGEDVYSRKKRLIKVGNELRKNSGDRIIAEHVVRKIHETRSELAKPHGEDLSKPQRICYIVNSIKHVDEHHLFKKLYGSLYYLIGVYADLQNRIRSLKQIGLSDTAANELIEVDFDNKIPHGQNVKKTFPLSDLFINTTENVNITNQAVRFFDALFGTKIVTPTTHEQAMYSAWASSLNSACLSRQVGACVTDAEGSILGLGWNDVPKYGGGVYNTGPNDRRCFLSTLPTGKHCRNDNQKDFITKELVAGLMDKGIVKKEDYSTAVDFIRNHTTLKDLLEFSKAVHAEMAALFSAVGSASERVKGGNVYVTTYPCHNCARHIVLTGIHYIYFIEPYPKSKAVELHNDSLSDINVKNRVVLRSFEGVSPIRFQDVFSMHGRAVKNDGIMILGSEETASHRFGVNLKAIWELEKSVSEIYINNLKQGLRYEKKE